MPRFEWRIAFMVVALRRAEPLWEAAKLPQEIRADPSGAISTAREFLLATAGAQEPSAIQGPLARAFDRLAGEYGEPVADSFRSWAQRHFVRDKPRGPLEAWTDLFLSVANPSNRHLDASLRIDPARKVTALSLIREDFRNRYRDLEKLEKQAEAMPRGDIEAKLTAFDPTVLDDGFVGTHFPVVARAFLVAGAELAADTWAALDRILEPQEHREFVRWARATASERRISADLLQVP